MTKKQGGGKKKGGWRLISRHRGGWPVLLLRVVIILLVLWVAVLVGTHAKEDIRDFEKFVDELGVWGPVFYLVALIVLTSFFFPDSVFGLVAGVMYGLWWGTVLLVTGVVLTAILNFWLSRRVMREPFRRFMNRHTKLRAVEQAANEGGLRLVLLLRLAPISPVTVSYTLGVSQIRVRTFLIGLAALVPGLFVEVYFGYVSAHVASLAGGVHHHSVIQSVVTIGGFVVCVVGMIWIARMTRRALAEASDEMGETRLDSPAGELQNRQR
ncbi:MAG: VTT domain-containing protein [Verrucomicrobiota bacterium]